MRAKRRRVALDEVARTQLMVAASGPSRARGLLLRRRSGGQIILVPCNDVHTVGMVRKLDIAFIDCFGVVLEAHRSVGPMRRLRCPHAAATIERFAECGAWFSAGDKVGLVAFAAREQGRGE